MISVYRIEKWLQRRTDMSKKKQEPVGPQSFAEGIAYGIFCALAAVVLTVWAYTVVGP